MPEVALFNNSGQNLTPKKVFFIFMIFIYQKQDTLLLLTGQTSGFSHLTSLRKFQYICTRNSMVFEFRTLFEEEEGGSKILKWAGAQTSHINTFFMLTFSTLVISMCKISSQNSFYRQSRIFGVLYMLVLTLIFKLLHEIQADEV